MNIPVRDYTWKADGKEIKAGFIAQELYKVYPDAVYKGSEGELDSTGPWMINHSALTPLLVKSIQDLKKEIEILKKENSPLKEKTVSAAQKQEITKIKEELEKLKIILSNK